MNNIVKDYVFVNKIEKADATKVNANFDKVYLGANNCITELNNSAGSCASLTTRLAVSLADGGEIKPTAFPTGTYDTRSTRSTDSNTTAIDGDAIIRCDTALNVVTVTLPSATAKNINLCIIRNGSYAVIISPDPLDTINGSADDYTLDVDGETVMLIRDAHDWKIV